MGIQSFITKENVVVGIDAIDKASAIAQLVGHASLSLPLDTVAVTKLLLAREQKKSSGCGKQIAIPHVINSIIPSLMVILGIFKNPVPWDSVDGKSVRIVCIVLCPSRQVKDYFVAVGAVSKSLSDESIRLSLSNMKTIPQVLTVLNAAKG